MSVSIWAFTLLVYKCVSFVLDLHLVSVEFSALWGINAGGLPPSDSDQCIFVCVFGFSPSVTPCCDFRACDL